MDDRFYSATGTVGSVIVTVCSNFVGVCNNTITANQVEVVSSDGQDFYDNKFYLIIY